MYFSPDVVRVELAQWYPGAALIALPDTIAPPEGYNGLRTDPPTNQAGSLNQHESKLEKTGMAKYRITGPDGSKYATARHTNSISDYHSLRNLFRF